VGVFELDLEPQPDDDWSGLGDLRFGVEVVEWPLGGRLVSAGLAERELEGFEVFECAERSRSVRRRLALR
jgi:hypothetical protein